MNRPDTKDIKLMPVGELWNVIDALEEYCDELEKVIDKLDDMLFQVGCHGMECGLSISCGLCPHKSYGKTFKDLVMQEEEND